MVGGWWEHPTVRRLCIGYILCNTSTSSAATVCFFFFLYIMMASTGTGSNRVNNGASEDGTVVPDRTSMSTNEDTNASSHSGAFFEYIAFLFLVSNMFVFDIFLLLVYSC